MNTLLAQSQTLSKAVELNFYLMAFSPHSETDIFTTAVYVTVRQL